MPATGSAAMPGDTFTATYSLLNTMATSAFSTNFMVSYYLCSSLGTTSCVLLGISPVLQNFLSGGTLGLSSPTLTIPKLTKAGAYYVRAFVDSGGKVAESNEGNNNRYDMITVGSKLKPDLYFSQHSASVKSGTVTTTVMVCNQGDALNSGFSVSFYNNRTLPPICATTASQTWTVGALAKSACNTKTIVRTNVKPGLYHDWALADSACVVSEASETNNAKSAAYKVGLPSPDQGVLADATVISSDAGPAEAGVGDLTVVDAGAAD